MNPQGEHGITWCDATWNPTTGCSKVSLGCKNCYADRLFPRVYPGRKFTEVQLHPARLDQPLHWRKPRKVFVNSMSDLFHEDIPFTFVAAVFGVMAACPQHEFQILTKRPKRIWNFLQYLTDRAELARELFPHDSDTWRLLQCLRGAALKHGVEFSHSRRPVQVFPLPNVWLGVSVEDQATANERIPLLLNKSAAKRFLSIEPLLGPVDLSLGFAVLDGHGEPSSPRCKANGSPCIDFVIVGGESGPKARPMDVAWVRSIRDQCQEAGVPFHFKQGSQANWANYKDFASFPVDLQIREDTQHVEGESV